MSVPITKPTVGADNGTWGTELNAALDALNAADLFALRTADRAALSATTTPVDDGVLAVTLGVGTYVIEAVYLVVHSTTGDFKVQWNFAGTASSGFRSGIGPSLSTADVLGATAQGVRLSGSGATAAALTSLVAYGCDTATPANISMIIEKAVVVVTVGGILKAQVCQNTAAGTTTVKAGSYIWARQVA